MENTDFDKILKSVLSEKLEPPLTLNKKIVETANNVENIHSVTNNDEKNIIIFVLISVFFTFITGFAVYVLISSVAIKLFILLMFTVSVAGEITLLVFTGKHNKNKMIKGVLQ